MYLLDTNVISELRKARSGRANENVCLWADSVHANDLFLSVCTIQELETGVQRVERRDPSQGEMLRTWLEGQIMTSFENRILPVSQEVAITSAGFHVPDPKPAMDMLIAATSMVHGLILVTRNVADFDVSGLKILNPWGDTT